MIGILFVLGSDLIIRQRSRPETSGNIRSKHDQRRRLAFDQVERCSSVVNGFDGKPCASQMMRHKVRYIYFVLDDQDFFGHHEIEAVMLQLREFLTQA